MLFEREKHELQDDMVNQEQCINKKIKILEMHLEQNKNNMEQNYKEIFLI